MAFEYAKKIKVDYPASWDEIEMAGGHWAVVLRIYAASQIIGFADAVTISFHSNKTLN